MYSILIVDDEKLICEGIRARIQKIGFHAIGDIYTAFSGNDAVKIFYRHNPSIVITDICMPEMDGLEFIKKVSTDCSSTKFIILSGYNEFQYAKTALKLGVMDYLLKPCSFENLKGVLETAVKLLNKERTAELAVNNSNAAVAAEVWENAMNRLFAGTYLHGEEVEALLKKIRIRLPMAYFCISILRIDPGTLDRGLIQMVESTNTDGCSHLQGGDEVRSFCFISYKNCLVQIFNFSQIRDYTAIKESVYRLMGCINHSGDFRAIAGLSDSGRELESLIALYNQAEEALSYRFLYDSESVIEFNQCRGKEEKVKLSPRQVEELVEYIKSGETDKFAGFIDGIFNRIELEKYTVLAIERLYKGVFNMIASRFGEIDAVAFQNCSAEYKEFAAFENVRDIRIFLKDFIFKLRQRKNDKRKEQSPVDFAIAYAKANMDKEVDMAVIANLLNMNYSYFSKVFKDNMGMNFSEYLTRLRMEEAKRLLKEPDYKVLDVSSRLGYVNPKNFTRAFKNYVGYSPKDYRAEKSD